MARSWSEAAAAALASYPWSDDLEKARAKEEAELVSFGACVEVEDLPLVVNELRAMGLDTFRTEEPVVLPKLFGGLQNIFFKGPSGELIELIEHFEAGEHEPRL